MDISIGQFTFDIRETLNKFARAFTRDDSATIDLTQEQYDDIVSQMYDIVDGALMGIATDILFPDEN